MNNDGIGGEESGNVFSYSGDNEDEPAATIARAVAWLKGLETTELEPLYYVIDVDALRAILTHSTTVGYRGRSRGENRKANDSANVNLRVSFVYEGFVVTAMKEAIHLEAPEE